MGEESGVSVPIKDLGEFVYLPPKPQDLLKVQKIVHRMNGNKRKIDDGQIFEKAANVGP